MVEQNQTTDWLVDMGKFKAILLGDKQKIPYIRGKKIYTHLVGYD